MTVPWLARDLIAEAAGHLDEPVADYFFGAADRGRLMHRNYQSWQRFSIAPSYLSRPPRATSRTSFLGRHLDTPLVVAPIAFQSILDPAGEPGLAFAAGVAGFGYTISTRSSRRLSAISDAFELGQRIDAAEIDGLDEDHRILLESFAGQRHGELWLQVYQTKDHDFVGQLLDTGAEVGVKAAALTIDTPYLGARYRDSVHGFSPVDRLKEVLAVEDQDGPAFGDGFSSAAIAQAIELDVDGFIRDCEQRGIDPMFKGVLSTPDWGAMHKLVTLSSVTPWISNHGGRQSDLLPTTAEALSLLRGSLAGGECIVDGGIGDPTDAICALALGARVVAIGRPLMAAYALGGVRAATEYLIEFRHQLVRQLAILGYESPRQIDPRAVQLRLEQGRSSDV
ncbi:alpha-hydroxy acid oxidase [Ferrimicrobium acidiphilum]|uniref:(S)-mandelate dehydrogenase n=1 Tax=Ferrimicrobium acidiphilum DSM 19497 TaxID=1121877 RepID=A0A0D8FUZ0_9ACTN|nr:alpha-hydroxy acid oxidase [Ferrimicrobium acidiphilum]KJE77095.1 (S)-mandelate dehydrogenase [Ferrimicrobium acidiphilum DSM 19497]